MSKPQYPPEAGEPPSLRGELRAVEARHAGWHAYLSDGGRCLADGSNVTVNAGTPQQLDRLIAQAEHGWSLTAGSAA